MRLHELLPRLSGVRKGGNGYAAKCPAHKDKRQSLSLAEDSGRILINCFAGCTGDKVISSLGLEWKDLFDKGIDKPSRSSLGDYAKRSNSKATFLARSPRDARIHTVYPYVDENGRLLYENVRFVPKDFRPRRFGRRGEVLWNLDGVERVPYRLPSLIEGVKAGADIFFCEGEKDADAMRELGLTATNFKGWKPEMNRYVEGCHAIVMQDHDEPGVQLANEAAKTLLPSVATVKVLDVFGDRELPAKGGPDVSDYIRGFVQDEGLDADEIKERICLLADRCENWRDKTDPTFKSYFVIQSGNEWMSQSKSKPNAKMLFDRFWYEGEICILFADTNVGKSILAMQIADAISRGVSVDRLVNEAPSQKVVYFDFELTAKQFETRFAEKAADSEQFVNHYSWHHNFYRAEINPETSDLSGFTKFEDYLNHSLDAAIVETGAKVLIVDNLTYLRDETENARNALPLMKYLKELKLRHGLAILALAHTPKRDSSKPLGRNDLQGSKMLINFCDSSFAIGESANAVGLRYLKQIKARNTEIVYHTENVLLARIEKDGNFLKFRFCGTATEHEHLKRKVQQDREGLIRQAKELRDNGLTLAAIAKRLEVSEMSVHRYLKIAVENLNTPSNPDVS